MISRAILLIHLFAKKDGPRDIEGIHNVLVDLKIHIFVVAEKSSVEQIENSFSQFFHQIQIRD